MRKGVIQMMFWLALAANAISGTKRWLKNATYVDYNKEWRLRPNKLEGAKWNPETQKYEFLGYEIHEGSAYNNTRNQLYIGDSTYNTIDNGIAREIIEHQNNFDIDDDRPGFYKLETRLGGHYFDWQTQKIVEFRDFGLGSLIKMCYSSERVLRAIIASQLIELLSEKYKDTTGSYYKDTSTGRIIRKSAWPRDIDKVIRGKEYNAILEDKYTLLINNVMALERYEKAKKQYEDAIFYKHHTEPLKPLDQYGFYIKDDTPREVELHYYDDIKYSEYCCPFINQYTPSSFTGLGRHYRRKSWEMDFEKKRPIKALITTCPRRIIEVIDWGDLPSGALRRKNLDAWKEKEIQRWNERFKSTEFEYDITEEVKDEGVIWLYNRLKENDNGIYSLYKFKKDYSEFYRRYREPYISYALDCLLEYDLKPDDIVKLLTEKTEMTQFEIRQIVERADELSSSDGDVKLNDKIGG